MRKHILSESCQRSIICQQVGPFLHENSAIEMFFRVRWAYGSSFFLLGEAWRVAVRHILLLVTNYWTVTHIPALLVYICFTNASAGYASLTMFESWWLLKPLLSTPERVPNEIIVLESCVPSPDASGQKQCLPTAKICFTELCWVGAGVPPGEPHHPNLWTCPLAYEAYFGREHSRQEHSSRWSSNEMTHCRDMLHK